MDHTVLPANYTTPAFCFASIHQMAPRLTEVEGIWLELANHLSTGITVYLRQYIMAGHFLIPRIPKTGFDLTPGFKSDWKERDPGYKFPPKVQLLGSSFGALICCLRIRSRHWKFHKSNPGCKVWIWGLEICKTVGLDVTRGHRCEHHHVISSTHGDSLQLKEHKLCCHMKVMRYIYRVLFYRSWATDLLRRMKKGQASGEDEG